MSTPPNNEQLPVTQIVTQEKMHYDSLISLFKYCIGAVSILATVAGYIFFQNGKDMREQLNEDRKYVESQVAELKKQVEDQRGELTKSADELHSDLRTDVADFKTGAMNRISSVEDIATSQARNRINEIFRDRNFDEFVDDVARERMEPRIQLLVDKRLDSLKQERDIQIQAAIRDLADISVGIQQRGLTILQSTTVYNLQDSHLSLIAKQLDPNKMNSSIYLATKSLLAGKRSKVADDFFVKALSSKHSEIYDVEDAILYFVRFDNNPDFYSIIIETTKNIRYGQMIGSTSFQSNKPLFSALMNNKRFLDALLDPSIAIASYPNFQEQIKEEFRNDYKQAFPTENISKVYLFQMK